MIVTVRALWLYHNAAIRFMNICTNIILLVWVWPSSIYILTSAITKQTGCMKIHLEYFFQYPFCEKNNGKCKKKYASKKRNILLVKGQLISKKNVKRRILQKNEQINSFLLVCDVFSFVFWKNPWPEKNVSRLSDL